MAARLGFSVNGKKQGATENNTAKTLGRWRKTGVHRESFSVEAKKRGVAENNSAKILGRGQKIGVYRESLASTQGETII